MEMEIRKYLGNTRNYAVVYEVWWHENIFLRLMLCKIPYFIAK